MVVGKEEAAVKQSERRGSSAQPSRACGFVLARFASSSLRVLTKERNEKSKRFLWKKEEKRRKKLIMNFENEIIDNCVGSFHWQAVD